MLLKFIHFFSLTQMEIVFDWEHRSSSGMSAKERHRIDLVHLN